MIKTCLRVKIQLKADLLDMLS